MFQNYIVYPEDEFIFMDERTVVKDSLGAPVLEIQDKFSLQPYSTLLNASQDLDTYIPRLLSYLKCSFSLGCHTRALQ